MTWSHPHFFSLLLLHDAISFRVSMILGLAAFITNNNHDIFVEIINRVFFVKKKSKTIGTLCIFNYSHSIFVIRLTILQIWKNDASKDNHFFFLRHRSIYENVWTLPIEFASKPNIVKIISDETVSLTCSNFGITGFQNYVLLGSTSNITFSVPNM